MAGVNPALTQSLLEHVKGLRADGMTVMFVEHDMDVVHDISDWVVVMGEGRIIAEGTPDQISANPQVIDAYLGAHHDVDLGDSEGIKALEQELVADEESIVGTENAGIIAVDVVAPELHEPGHTDKDKA
jgi:branched-chain amino acid transport system ATP-binding protein